MLELVSKEKSKIYNHEIYKFVHKNTKAKVMYIKTDDLECMFKINFNMPNLDSMGTRHVMEHLICEGSNKYPYIDYTNIKHKLKLTTRNATTYFDMMNFYYSSKDKSDFISFLDIQLSSIFDPLFLSCEEIFIKHGKNIVINNSKKEYGVVYNEMKAKNLKNNVIIRNEILKKLETNESSIYSNGKYISGGDLIDIPKLKYNDVCTYYTNYVHPSNSITVITGNYTNKELNVILNLIDSYFNKYSYKKYNFKLNTLDTLVNSNKISKVSMNYEGTLDKTFTLVYKVPRQIVKSPKMSLSLDTIISYLTSSGSKFKTALNDLKLFESFNIEVNNSLSEMLIIFKFINICNESNTEKKLLKSLKDLLLEEFNNLNIDLLESSLNKNVFKTINTVNESKLLDNRIDSYIKYEKYYGITYGNNYIETSNEILKDIKDKNKLITTTFKNTFITNNTISILFSPDKNYSCVMEELEAKNNKNNKYDIHMTKEEYDSYINKYNLLFENGKSINIPKYINNKELTLDFAKDKLLTEASVKSANINEYLINNKINVRNYKYNSKITNLRLNYDVTSFSPNEIILLDFISILMNKLDTKTIKNDEFILSKSKVIGQENTLIQFKNPFKRLSKENTKISSKVYFTYSVSLDDSKLKDTISLIKAYLYDLEFNNKDKIIKVINEIITKVNEERRNKLTNSFTYKMIRSSSNELNYLENYKLTDEGLEYYKKLLTYLKKKENYNGFIEDLNYVYKKLVLSNLSVSIISRKNCNAVLDKLINKLANENIAIKEEMKKMKDKSITTPLISTDNEKYVNYYFTSSKDDTNSSDSLTLEFNLNSYKIINTSSINLFNMFIHYTKLNLLRNKGVYISGITNSFDNSIYMFTARDPNINYSLSYFLEVIKSLEFDEIKLKRFKENLASSFINKNTDEFINIYESLKLTHRDYYTYFSESIKEIEKVSIKDLIGIKNALLELINSNNYKVYTHTQSKVKTDNISYVYKKV